MKSTFWKKLIVLVFILSIGSYVAYRVGAFDGIFKDKNVEKISAKVKPDENAHTEEISPELEDFLFSTSKSAPFTESKKESSKSQKQDNTKNHPKNVEIMYGSKSAPFRESKKDSSNNQKQDITKSQPKNDDLMPGSKSFELDLIEVDSEVSEVLDKVFKKPEQNMPNQNQKKTSK